MKLVTDWEKVRLDYVTGLSVPDLARKHDIKIATIRQQIIRKQWNERKRQAVTMLSQVKGIEVLADARNLVAMGNQMLQKMADDANTSVKTLMREHADTGVTDIEALEKRERTAGMLVKRIKETCGLDDVKPTGLVVIGQFTRFEDESITKAIDVNATITPDDASKG